MFDARFFTFAVNYHAAKKQRKFSRLREGSWSEVAPLISPSFYKFCRHWNDSCARGILNFHFGIGVRPEGLQMGA